MRGASFTVQTSPVKKPVRIRARAGSSLAVALSGAACKRQIGDDCKTAADCDPNGTRACDLSQPGGYCTIQGCDETTCPERGDLHPLLPDEVPDQGLQPRLRGSGPVVDAGCQDAGQDGGSDAGGGDGGDRGWSDKRLRGRRDLPRVRALRAALDREALLRQGLRQQRRLPRRLRVPAAGREGSMVLSATVDASTSFCAPYVPVN